MDLRQYSKEDLIKINELLISGLPMADIEKRIIPTDLKLATEVMHSMFCRTTCDFDKEEDYSLQNKSIWLSEVMRLVSEYDATGHDIIRALNVIGSMELMINRLPPEMRALVRALIPELSRQVSIPQPPPPDTDPSN